MTEAWGPTVFSVVLETHNLMEGTDRGRFRAAVSAALAMKTEEGQTEVLICDNSGNPEVAVFVGQEFPKAKRIDTTGLGYDQSKARAVRAASGRYILFLDGDCLPGAEWHQHLLRTLQSGKAAACAGYTRYEGGVFAAIMTIQDFGFFIPLTSRALACYASNNCGFLRELLEAVPVPEADMRCSCFAHAQILLHRGTPVWLIPEAYALHELPPVVRERTRQGYDAIAACWSNPALPEAKWLRWGIWSIAWFYALAIYRDWRHIRHGYKDLGLTTWTMILTLPLFPLLRLLDVGGMARAFIRGPAKGGWAGWEGRRRACSNAR